MKSFRFFFAVSIIFMTPPAINAQTVSPARQTINKSDVSGLNLATSIPEKQLKQYWASYLSRYGKVKNKKGVISLERAYIQSISANPVSIKSTTSSTKNISTLFLAIQENGKYISSASDAGYLESEQLLKDFTTYATAQEELRLVKQDFTQSQDEQKKLVREKDRLTRDIEKTEKELEKLRQALSQKEVELENYNAILQNKQKGVEAVEAKTPGN